MSEQRTTQAPRVVTWEEVVATIDILAPLIQRQVSITSIVPVIRGGLVPATLLSHATGLPIRFATNPRANLIAHNDDPGILLLDDISGSGETFTQLARCFPRARRVALYGKPAGTESRHMAIHQVPQDVWVVFPWERE